MRFAGCGDFDRGLLLMNPWTNHDSHGVDRVS